MKGPNNLIDAAIEDVPSVLAQVRTTGTRALTQALEGLPDALAVVLALRYVEDFADHEIAWLLQVPERRVAELHAEALLKLQSALGR